MANAVKRISVARGHDVTRYTLQCFGGAGGQHACLVADALGMRQVFCHPLAGVLSAYGMGLADQIAMREAALERVLDASGRGGGPPAGRAPAGRGQCGTGHSRSRAGRACAARFACTFAIKAPIPHCRAACRRMRPRRAGAPRQIRAQFERELSPALRLPHAATSM